MNTWKPSGTPVGGWSDMMGTIIVSLLLLGRAMAQMTMPSNDTTALSGDVGFLMTTMLNNMNTTVHITPLTGQAGLAGTLAQLQQINPTGPLYLTNGNTVNGLQSGNIAYISCEGNGYTGPVGAGRTMDLAASNRPSAIVLYSPFAARCSFNPSDDFSYTSLYTMTDANSSSMVLFGLEHANPPNPNASIRVDSSTTNNTGTDSGSSSVLGRSPTTAVAMIILYSITGIITALFLIIIIVGAVRAHRHPERYGPRRIAGRPRQSRAKGIARAMLETLPIVKFGDLEEDNKRPEQGRDVELGSVAHPEHGESAGEGSQQGVEAAEASRTEPNGTGLEMVRTEPASEGTKAPSGTLETGTPAVDNGLACSVCVDDFVKGQDIRLLPCKHKFHPECIDPWLLNVSGTCPLCRVDLRPTTSHGSEREASPDPLTVQYPNDTAEAVPGSTGEDGVRRNRRSRILSVLNIGRMRDATPEERINALRRLREEGIAAADDEPSRTRRRFSHRISRAFSSRPNSSILDSRPVSEVPAAAITSPLHQDHAVSTPDHEPFTTTERPPDQPSSSSTAPGAETDHTSTSEHLTTIPSTDALSPTSERVEPNPTTSEPKSKLPSEL